MCRLCACIEVVPLLDGGGLYMWYFFLRVILFFMMIDWISWLVGESLVCIEDVVRGE